MKSAPYNKVFTRRIIILAGLKIAVVLAIVGRYFHLQINERKKYQTLSDSNKFALRFNAPERGLIRDKNNKILANNFNVYQLSMIPENTPSVSQTLQVLQEIHPISDEKMQAIHKKIKATKKFKSVILLNNLDDASYNKIMVNYHRLKGLSIDEVPKRFYPYAEKMSHITGYVGNPSKKDITNDAYNKRLVGSKGFAIGRIGLEKAENVLLRGIPGIEQLEVNAYGRPVFSQIIKPSTQGKDIHLTIDADLQNHIHKIMKTKIAGSAVVLNAQTGAILAMVNVPSYDCNLLVQGISSNEWKKLINNELAPLNNRACSSAYPPGSTFKPMVALAALREGIPTSSTHHCKGSIKVGSYVFRCWKKNGHGTMDLHGAIRESCDVWFYNTAWRLGINKIATEAKKFGLGSAPELPFAGITSGLVGTTAWKRKTHNAPWYLGDTLVASIGQGYMLSSPLQLATMTARIASGNMSLKPHIMINEKNEEHTNSAIHYDMPHNLNEVRQGLWQVVNQRNGGTAFKSRISDNNFQMAGKTGTSQVRRLTDEERKRIKQDPSIVPWKLKEHALFTAYAPFDSPRYAVAIIVEHGGSGSRVAAPIANKIMDYLRKNEASKT